MTDEPTPAALEAELVAAAASVTLSAAAGVLTLWPGDDGTGVAELSLALAGRYRPAEGSVRLLGRPADPAELRRQVVLARVVDAVEPEPRLTVAEYLDSCAVLQGRKHNRMTLGRALDDVGLAEEVMSRRIEHLDPGDLIRACVAGALLCRPVAVVVDRVDRGIGEADWTAVAADLRRAADLTGVAIVASCIRAEVAA